MKFPSILLVLTFAITACSSSEADRDRLAEPYSNLVKLHPPDTHKVDSSRVYIDSVRVIRRGERKALLISGNFPDGCTQLQHANHTMEKDTLIISLSAWKPADKMCTQAMVPFSFVYDKLTKDRIPRVSALTVNKENFKINP